MQKKTCVGVIGAMDAEVDALKAAMTDTRTEQAAGMTFCAGRLAGKDAVVVRCGMGKVNAGICAQTLISRFGVTEVINTGVAGSLDNRIGIGDVVISEDAAQHDFDVSPIGFQRGEIPYTGLVAFPADKTLREAAKAAAQSDPGRFSVFEGRICSGDQFLTTREQKNTVTERFGGLCCEMEGAAIAQVCYLNETPFVILRAISDKVDGSEEMEFSRFAEMAAARCAGIVLRMVEGIR
ncbi:MAG: 5'-methylthioadenosine/adenosylhomocysteine nucleosidase [Oscillospiraceae bacterium]|nr:5'-methylthioadenosine/adenosylhomocysteine nucleosidase [Oscillospiraceae bacterium]